MDIPKRTRQLCKKYNICPSRSKGQNFLIRERVYKKIVETADLHKDDVVLEVGPGLGFLTERLAEQVKKVIAVELDDELVNILQQRLDEQKVDNVKLVNNNILKILNIEYLIFNNLGLISNNQRLSYKVVANLPYNITSRFLRMFLEEVKVKPSMLVLMVQKEVAERIIAEPPKMSLLAVAVQFYAKVKIMANVPKEAFWPKPKVDSAIITLTPSRHSTGQAAPLPEVLRDEGELWEKKFFKLVRAGFSAKRKQLQNNLAKGLGVEQKIIKEILRENGFDEKIRAQELSVDDWYNLYVVLERRNMV